MPLEAGGAPSKERKRDALIDEAQADGSDKAVALFADRSLR